VTRAVALACLLLLASAARGDEQPQPPAEPAGPPKTSAEAADRLGLKFTPGAELVITSDEAEGVKAADGRQTVVFTKRVKARQGDMNLTCDWLQAIYPPTAAGHPDKINAKGSVVITQGTNQALCTEAQVDNVACTAECHSGSNQASLHRATDDVLADTIYFDLCKSTVKAVGNVSVRVRQTDPNAPTPAPAAETKPSAPSPTPARKGKAPAAAGNGTGG
jgi:lipopolysaccharide export system protein LptA